MADKGCRVAVCDRPHYAHGLCVGHYRRMRSTGSPGDSALKAWRRGCSVEGCDGEHYGNGFCRMHNERFARHGNTDTVLSGENHPLWTGDDASYRAVHGRLYSQRGKASAYPCACCGGPATQWAYDHKDPDEKEGQIGRGRVARYSVKLDHYQPSCVLCHMALDGVIGSRWRSPRREAGSDGGGPAARGVGLGRVGPPRP